MTMNEDNINNDGRNPIALTWGDGEAECWFDVRSKLEMCDKIEPYYENGEMAAVPWFRVLKAGVVIARVNAAHVRLVTYAP